MLLVFLGIIVIFGWAGLFVLINWLIHHAFDIIDIIIWIIVGYVSLFVLIMISIVIYFVIVELVEWIIDTRKPPNRKVLKKIKNKNITSDTNYIKSDKEFWEDV